MKERTLALTLVLAGLALANASSVSVGIVAVLAPITALVLGPRFALSRFAQTGVSVAALLAGILLARAMAPPEWEVEALSERALLLALPVHLVACARALMTAPVYGERLTLVAALVVLTAAGRVQHGLAFPLLAAGALLAGFLALRAGDPSRAPVKQLGFRHYGALSLGFTLAFGLTWLAHWGLPLAHRALLARAQSRFNFQQIGFSESMRLGALSGLLESDKVALRVRGKVPPLLRGVVLSRYETGRWEGVDANATRVLHETAPLPESLEGLTEIERAQPMPSQSRFYFATLGATEIVSSTGYYDRDGVGVLRPADIQPAKRIWFRSNTEAPEPAPTPAELMVPSRLSPHLAGVLREWGVAEQSAEEKLAIIERRLNEDYRYSTEFERPQRVEPVLDFLTNNKQGHCEYFASAFALLARKALVPSRVVSGYRVTERSPLGYAIVRERDAHSWVEVWLDGRWVTYDPTPASLEAAPRDRTSLIGALVDGLRTGWEVVDDWLTERSAFEFSLALVLLVGLLGLLRAYRGRDRSRRRAEAEEAPTELVALLAALAKLGVERAPHETLARLARRVSEAELGVGPRQAALEALRAYEVLRYGQEGDSDAVRGDLRRATEQLKSA